ncbi:MAG TPA: hypothetical protein VI318_04090 [Baekduia sp.]
MTYKMLGLLVGGLLLVSAAPASAARVSVEIEGQSVIKAPTVVDTAASVSKPGGASCSGAAPATALDSAVSGDWDGGAFSVERITTESHPIVTGGSSWALYVNGSFFNGTACDATLAAGDKVLFYWSDAFASEGYDEPVLLDAPTTATPGVPFTVTAKDVTTDFSTYPSPPSAQTPAAGATVSGGTAPATIGADGTAQVTVGAGPYTLVATHGNRAPARIAGCATNGSDGFCGTTQAALPTPAAVTTAAPDKVAALSRIVGIAEGKKYAKGKGPRQLSGRTDPDQTGVADIQLRLTRNDGGKCATYDGRTEKFKTIKKCGATHGVWFSVGANPSWSYLMPSKLGKGRYVLDVIVVDKAGNKTQHLARGTSRVVFTVA